MNGPYVRRALRASSAPEASSAERMTLKRAFDIAASAFLIVFFTPIFIITAVAIRLDSRGPVFFRQTRHGRRKVPFRIWKFRTMTVLEDGNSITQVRKNDSRVTRVGRILRATSVDELPQLFNVFVGEMSLVGPRPHACAHDVEFSRVIPEYDRRFAVRPGITGLAQVAGLRGETDSIAKIRARVRADIAYIRRQSFLFDMVILVRTVGAVISAQNAY